MARPANRNRILEKYWKLGTASVREILESLPEDEFVAYTNRTDTCLQARGKGRAQESKKIGNAQLLQPAFNQSQYRSRLVRDLVDLFGGSSRAHFQSLENGTITLRDLKKLQSVAACSKNDRSRGGILA